MTIKGSPKEKDNISFFEYTAERTLKVVKQLNQKDVSPNRTFEEIIKGIILRHAKEDPDFFWYRFNDANDIDLCAQTISIYVEEKMLRFLFDGHLDHLETFEKRVLSNIEDIAQNSPIDTDLLLKQCHRSAAFSIHAIQRGVRKKNLAKQAVRVRHFLQRSNDYYLINAFLSANIQGLAERLLQRRRLQAVLSVQVDHKSWVKVDKLLVANDDTEIRDSLPTQPFLVQ